MKFFSLALFSLLLVARSHAQRIAQDVITTQAGPLTIQPIQHATFVMTAGGHSIYVDPVGGSATFAGLPAPDLILITDIHGDHFNPGTLRAILSPNTILIVPKAVADRLTYDSLKSRAVVLNNGENTTRLGVSITAIPMYNLPESPTAMHTKGRGNGYVLNVGGKNIYISGDTQGIPEMRSLKNIDVAFVCMNLPYTMDVKEAADAVLAFKPKIVYPYHYRGQGGFSDVNAFKNLVTAGDPAIEVRLRDWYSAR